MGSGNFDLTLDRRAPDTVTIALGGRWLLRNGTRTLTEVVRELSAQTTKRVVFDAGGLGAWDSALVSFLLQLRDICRDNSIEMDESGLPEGARRLVDLASAVPERAGARRSGTAIPFLDTLGRRTLDTMQAAGRTVSFIGEVTLMFGRFLSGRANYRRSDLWYVVQQCGAEALPIVTIISLLVGMILAFVGAVQLEQFGAEIFVANLVGIAMVREMGAIMTGIVLAGRTGAAFAANIGTMQVNEEVDALATLGIPPIDFLVLPRMLALILMMPLLTIYADFVGMFGGYLVGVGMLDLTHTAYIEATRGSIDLTDFALGVFKGAVFGAIVAIAGCMHGLQSGRSSAAVGDAATAAVVTGIVYIIVADGIFAVLTNIVGI